MLRFLVLFFVLLPFGFSGTTQTDGMTLVQRACELSDIRASDAHPFRLKASFRQFSAGGKFDEGTYTETWLARGQWRRDLTLGPANRTEVRDKENRWVEGDEPPGRVSDVADLLDVTGIYSPLMKIGAVRDADMQDMHARCLDAEGGRAAKLCFDAQTGVLLSQESGENHPDHQAAFVCRYQRYEKFGGRIFPRRVACDEDGQPTLEIQVLEVSEISPDAAVLSPVEPRSSKPTCAGVVRPPNPTQKAQPVYPVRESLPGGQVIVGLTVAADGAVSDIRIVRSLSKAFDQSALQAVKTWVFEPATCDGKPFSARVNVEVEFKHP